MVPPRSAFGASPPGGRRQRTGKAGSAASAWSRAACLAAASLLWGAVAAEPADRTPKPAIEPAKAGTQCIAPTEVMRRDHPKMLTHQRDDTVRGGIRGAQASLRGCIDCHAGAATHSVAKAPGDFCVSCHGYAAVKIDCFDCHASTKGARR